MDHGFGLVCVAFALGFAIPRAPSPAPLSFPVAHVYCTGIRFFIFAIGIVVVTT